MIGSLLGNDLVINENDCNLACEYCLTGQSNLKDSHRDQLIFKTPRRDSYGPDTPLGERIDAIVDRIAMSFATPLLKITGGEVFLVDKIVDLVAAAAERFPSVVLQTNATLIRSDHLLRLRHLKNLTLQVSLDSHTYEGNQLRIGRRDLHDKTIEKIVRVLEARLPTEIYTVINVSSVEHLVDFACWLNNIGTDLQFFPFPVRGPERSRFAIRPEQIAHVERLVERSSEYARILPPSAYFGRLLRFYREGGRTFGCHLPRLVISSFSDGMITACPNIWFSELGSALDDDWKATFSNVGRTPLYHALLGPRPRLDACKGCFTPWDTLSMYFDDEISLDELCRSPVYRQHEVREYIARAKAAYRQQASSGTAA